MNKPTFDDLVQKFMRGGNCSQAVLGSVADDLGYDTEETDKMGACFGGGMMRGETCGAVTGAMMAIGLACDTPAEAMEKANRFQMAFAEKYGSTMCRDLLGYDLADQAQREQAKASGEMLVFCPQAVLAAIDILEEVLETGKGG